MFKNMSDPGIIPGRSFKNKGKKVLRILPVKMKHLASRGGMPEGPPLPLILLQDVDGDGFKAVDHITRL